MSHDYPCEGVHMNEADLPSAEMLDEFQWQATHNDYNRLIGSYEGTLVGGDVATPSARYTARSLVSPGSLVGHGKIAATSKTRS
jgi:hypothetical protein